jgi:hypothetical protein
MLRRDTVNSKNLYDSYLLPESHSGINNASCMNTQKVREQYELIKLPLADNGVSAIGLADELNDRFPGWNFMFCSRCLSQSIDWKVH